MAMFEFDEIDDLNIDQKLIRQIAVGGGVVVVVLDDTRQRTWEVCALRYDSNMNRDYRKLLSGSSGDDRARDREDLHKVFIDPFGVHVLISLKNGTNHFCHLGKRQEETSPVPCPKMQGKVFESCGWSKHDPSKGAPVLLGDVNGIIWEAKFGVKCRQVYSLGVDAPVTSIEVERFEKNTSQLLVMATASSRLFQFVGQGPFESLFEKQPFLREMPGTHSNLQLFRDSLNKAPAVFAWCTEAGILHGQVDLSRPQDSVISTETVLSFDSSFQGGDRSLLISRNHFFLLYSDRLVVVAQPPGLRVGSSPSEKLAIGDLKERTVWETPRRTFQNGTNYEPRGIVQDLKTGDRYVYTKKAVYQLYEEPGRTHPTWKIFLERAMNTKEVDREGYFKAALELSKDEPARLARVQEARGDYFFERGEYQRAAKQYSQTNKSFEEIAIQYIRHGKQEELLGLVELKLVHIVEAKQGFQDKATQICCLCTWCAQLHLAKMNKLVDDEEAYAEAQEEFHDFLTNHLEDMDKVTICDLIATSARPDEFLFLIELLTDYQRLIAQYMTQNKPDKALDCLIKHCFSEKYEELWYIFSPRLIQHAPQKLVSGWMATPRNGGKVFLRPPRLIPALMKYDVKFNPPGVTQNQAVRYLQWLIKQGNRDQAIHTMLLSLYAKQEDDRDLLEFLDAHRNNYYYDLRYALRLCLTEENYRACVHVYSALCLYEDAVKCALRIEDFELAKRVADQADEVPQRKKLWMHIARHVIKHAPNGDQAAIAMLPECNVLELEDILPYFHDFVYIQDFKQEISQCLEGYQRNMEQLKHRMDHVTQDASLIQSNIDAHKRCSHYVNEAMKCAKCYNLALTSNLVVFLSCQHRFHEKCLAEEVLQLMQTAASFSDGDTVKLKRKIANVKQFLANPRDDVPTETLDALQADCPYCGAMMISEISLPFFSEESDTASWRISCR